MSPTFPSCGLTDELLSNFESFLSSASDIATADLSTASLISEQISLPVTDMELEEMSLSKDSITQMKAAFLYYIRRNFVSFRLVFRLFFDS